ncbi:MAG: protein-L-isoaspartate O-methyltransferase [Candidatus Altiarchaeota archaeon]
MMNRKKEREELIKRLFEHGYIKSRKVLIAMKKVPREEFVPEWQRRYAYDDRPLEIGYGQTISAPHMVAIMTDALDVKKNHKILEVGSGSGYQAAILAEIAKSGKIFTVERIAEIAKFAEENLKKCGYENVSVIIGDGTLGYEKEKPYDRIIVTAAAPKIPKPLIEQLKEDGKLLIPVGNRGYQDLILIEKNSEGKIKESNLGGCIFVPLIGKEGW